MRPSADYAWILGVERCGSTWLSNILDAAGSTLFYMEPFAAGVRLLPEFPSRLLYMEGGAPLLEDITRGRLDRLYRYKYPLWDRHDAAPAVRYGVRTLLKTLGTTGRLAHIGEPLVSTRYTQLNLNRRHDRLLIYRQKQPHPQANIIKELRLNFKVRLVTELYPSARYVVVIRNPLAQVGSMLRLFERGELVQLREALHAFPEALRGQRRFTKYREALETLDGTSLLERAVAYWFVNYATLIEDLEASRVPYRLVRHEDLSTRPEEESRAVFDFLGLPLDDGVVAYLLASTHSDATAASPVDTKRESRTYARRSTLDVPNPVTTRVLACADRFWHLTPKPVRWYDEFLGSLL